MADKASASESTKKIQTITVATTPSLLIVDEASAQETIQQFEALFRDRYTDKDDDFVKTLSKELPPPPCVTNFFTRPKRNYYDRSRQNQREGHGGGYHDRNYDRGNYRGHRGQYGGHRGSQRYQPYGGHRYDNRHDQGSRYQPYHHGDRQYQDNRYHHGNSNRGGH